MIINGLCLDFKMFREVCPSSTFHREGYRFTGWYENPNNPATQWHDEQTVTADTTLHAHWTPTPPNFVIGDVNRDGFVTSADATLLARHIAKHGTLPASHTAQDIDICLLSADLNGNGSVTINDLIALAKWLIGFPLHDD